MGNLAYRALVAGAGPLAVLGSRSSASDRSYARHHGMDLRARWAKPVLGDRLSCNDQHFLQFVPKRGFALQSARHRSNFGDHGRQSCAEVFL
jgi:hypothetical protein